jgi:hypothetical protein
VKFICCAAVRARSRGRAVKSAMETLLFLESVAAPERGNPPFAEDAKDGPPGFVALGFVALGFVAPGFVALGFAALGFVAPGFVALGFVAGSGMGMVTARDSGRRRRPLQTGQRLADMYCIMYSR